MQSKGCGAGALNIGSVASAPFKGRCITKYCYWFPAEYRADTFMLTWEQDLAYRRMLDLAYETEKPLPMDRAQLYGLIRANTKTQQKAVDFVLAKYWRKAARNAHGHVNQRVSKELKRYSKKRLDASSAGKASALARNGGSTVVQQTLNYSDSDSDSDSNATFGGKFSKSVTKGSPSEKEKITHTNIERAMQNPHR